MTVSLCARTGMTNRWGANNANEVMNIYSLDEYNASAPAAYVQADSDASITCPLQRLAVVLFRRNIPVFMYSLSHYKAGIDVAHELGVIDDKDRHGWSSHGSDIPFVWGNHGGPDLYDNHAINVPFTSDERDLSRSMRNYWTSFARDGIPVDRVSWPPFLPPESNETIPTRVLLLQTENISVLENFRFRQCEFWGKYNK